MLTFVLLLRPVKSIYDSGMSFRQEFYMVSQSLGNNMKLIDNPFFEAFEFFSLPGPQGR